MADKEEKTVADWQRQRNELVLDDPPGVRDEVRLVDIDLAALGQPARTMKELLDLANQVCCRISVKHKEVVVPGGPMYDVLEGQYRLLTLFQLTPEATVRTVIHAATYNPKVKESTAPIEDEIAKLRFNTVEEALAYATKHLPTDLSKHKNKK
jgi:hypothetical protein